MDARVTIQHHMSEECTDSMEALLPALAQMALQRAHRRALATNGVLVQARRSQLLETFADGTLRVIHIIAKPIAVARGTRDSGRARRDYKKLKMGFLC